MGRIMLQRRNWGRGHRRAGRRKAVVRQGGESMSASAGTKVDTGNSKYQCGRRRQAGWGRGRRRSKGKESKHLYMAIRKVGC